MYDLCAASTARLPSRARAVVYPNDEQELIEFLDLFSEYEIPHRLLGGMSNVVFKNGFYDGVIIKTDKITTKTLAENRITLGCGFKLSKAIHSMASLGYGGMEGLAGIPGTVGGMVKQNAGAFGYEVSDTFTEAYCYSSEQGKILRLCKSDMDFSYRHSILSDKAITLVSATFVLDRRSSDAINSQIADFREQRLRAQPVDCPSLGSVFKRHNGVGAGFYIDQAGLKGFSLGDAQISEKHAGFIVNRGHATADDFLRLVEHAKKEVYSKFGIELQEEIEII